MDANGDKATQKRPSSVENTHEALIDVEQFRQVKAKLAGATLRATNRGKASISCGWRSLRTLRPTNDKHPRAGGTNRRYYRCPGGNDGRLQAILDS